MGPCPPRFGCRRLVLAACLAWCVAGGSTAAAQDGVVLPPLTAKTAPPSLSREMVVRWALENNPEIVAVRQQRGIAAAAVVIARTYPFNPFLESKVEGANGPTSAGVTNHVINEHKVLMELELHGQRGYRQDIATAALQRTEWEIVFQEVLLVARVLKAFDGVLYRQEKLRLADERLRLNERAAEQIRKLREQGKLSPADLILIQTEVNDSQATRAGAQAALVAAEFDLHRAAGDRNEPLPLAGSLQGQVLPADLDGLLNVAFASRADLRARRIAVAESGARVQLERSNRFGNPILGPSYTLDSTQVSSIGMQVSIPLPVFNVHSGDILQRQAEQARAMQELRQV
jgi:outer membrane protein TolC